MLPNRQPYWRRAIKNGDSPFFGLGVPMLHGEGSFTEDELRETALVRIGQSSGNTGRRTFRYGRVR